MPAPAAVPASAPAPAPAAAPAALVAAATLSNRYISDRFLPDKAIDLVDEAAAQLKMEITSKPVELEAIDRRIMQLEMEKLSIEGELSGTNKEKNSEAILSTKVSPALERITNEINSLKQKQEKFSSQWSGEKELLNSINSLKAEEDKIKVQIEQAERAYDLNTAAQLKYGQLETVHRDREAQEAELLKVQAQGSFLKMKLYQCFSISVIMLLSLIMVKDANPLLGAYAIAYSCLC